MFPAGYLAEKQPTRGGCAASLGAPCFVHQRATVALDSKGLRQGSCPPGTPEKTLFHFILCLKAIERRRTAKEVTLQLDIGSPLHKIAPSRRPHLYHAQERGVGVGMRGGFSTRPLVWARTCASRQHVLAHHVGDTCCRTGLGLRVQSLAAERETPIRYSRLVNRDDLSSLDNVDTRRIFVTCCDASQGVSSVRAQWQYDADGLAC